MKTYNPGLYTPGAQARNGPTDDEGDRVGCRATDGGAHLEQHGGCHESSLDVQKCIHLSKHKQEGAVGEKIGRAIPANIVGRMELVGDDGDGGRDNKFVL